MESIKLKLGFEFGQNRYSLFPLLWTRGYSCIGVLALGEI